MPETIKESEIEALRLEVKRLNNRRLLRIQDSLPKYLALQFSRGLAFGLGSVVGATILVSILLVFLSKIDFIPIVGEWAKEIAAQIGTDRK